MTRDREVFIDGDRHLLVLQEICETSPVIESIEADLSNMTIEETERLAKSELSLENIFLLLEEGQYYVKY